MSTPRRYKVREDVIIEITEYIEVFYNRQGQQARFGYRLLYMKRVLCETRVA